MVRPRVDLRAAAPETTARGVTIDVDRADAASPDAAALLAAHVADMQARYPDEPWAGIGAGFEAFWLARLDGTAVGCVALRVLRLERVEVKHLFVALPARGRGVASALMDVLEAEADLRGAEIVLETGTRQPEAIGLYDRRGYRRRGDYPGADINETCSVYYERPRRR